MQIDANFLDLPRKREEVAAFVYNSAIEQLRDRYDVDVTDDAIVRASLSGQLQAFKKTPRARLYLDKGDSDAFREAEVLFIESETRNVHSYLKRVVHHLRRGRRKSLAIFFDNLDKRGDLQEEAFLIASAIAREWSAMTFICLRPGTFQRSRDQGVLDSIAPRIIEVHSPPIGLFLKRRLDYGSSIAAGEKPPPRGSEALSKSIAQEGAEVADFFMTMSASVQRDKSLVALFEAVANGNLREVLNIVGNVMASWHLNTSEIINAIRTDGVYYVTHHQALRAMLYASSSYFDPELSPLVNLFDIEFADPVEHFLRSICLFHLADSTHEVASQGFTPYADIAARVGAYSFTPDQIDTSLRFLFAKRLVEDDNFSETWPGSDHGLRLSLLGRYHLSELVARFAYLDAIVVDTPILDVGASRDIHAVEPIKERVARGRVFLRYLNECAQGVQGTPFYSHWDRTHQRLAGEMTDIEQRLSENA